MPRRSDKVELFLCMGSACHQLGICDVLPHLQRLLTLHQLETQVELKGAFCLECCGAAIVLKVGDRMFTSITPQNLEEKFATEIHAALVQASGRDNRGNQ